MIKPSLLVVDDDDTFRNYITLLLRGRSYLVDAVANADQLMTQLALGPIPSVILLDVLLPDSDGLEVMRKIKQAGVIVPVIMLSGVAHVKTVVEAMKLGACDFLMKPFDCDTLEKGINEIVESASEKEPERIPALLSDGEEADGLVTLNRKMHRLADIVKRV